MTTQPRYNLDTCVSDEVLNLSERKIFVHDESSNRKKIDVMRTLCPHPCV